MDIELNAGLNIFIGDNAQGKSNILESIFVLALTKSYLNVKDCNLIQENEEFTSIAAEVENSFNTSNLEVIIADGAKKLKVNHCEISRYSDYVSRLKVLIFNSYHLNFVKQGPNVRRKELNVVISQYSNSYMKMLQKFNAILKRRNQFLKAVSDVSDYNQVYFDTIDNQFSTLAVSISRKRREFIQLINEKLASIYEELTGFENLTLVYDSSIVYEEDKEKMISKFFEKLKNNYEKDKFYGVTLLGPHRDDYRFLLNGRELSVYGSQGQIREAILALRLAELLIFENKDEDYPILLLDDIFSELDVEKRNRLVKYIIDDVQTIVTTTDIHLIDEELVKKSKVFYVSDGRIDDDEKRDKR